LTIPQPSDRRTLARGAALVALYVGAAKLGLELSVAHGVITPVWAPTGLALAALVLWGRRMWPAVALGALIANTTSGASFPEAAAISVGNTLEAVIGATLLLAVRFRPALDRVRDVLALVFFAALVSTTASATNGVTTLLVSGDISLSDYGSEWLLWWVGDAMGALIVAPLIFVWAATPLPKLDRAKAIEAILLLALLVGVSIFVFLAGFWRYPHLVFPLLVWATLRFGQRGAVTSSFVVASIAIAGAVNGKTPLGDVSATEIVQILEGLFAGVVVSLLILGAVLAERESAKDEVEHAHGSLAEAQQLAHIGSWEWDISSDRVTWSDELYRLWGLAPQSVEVTYDWYLSTIHSDDRETARATIERAYANKAPFKFDHRVVRPDGSVAWIHGRGRVVAGPSGEPLRMLGTSQDITERKRIDELRDSILSTVSHELRTPLTSIIGFSLTLKDKGEQVSAATRARIVEHLTEQAHKLDRLLSDLLDLDRLRRGFVGPTFRKTDVARLVARVVADHPNGSHPIRVRTEPVEAEVDAPKVERIVENLITNAIKHTPPGTEISVRVERRDGDVLIAVDDTGPGVDARHREAIFELFNRGEAAFAHVPGMGIGLSLVTQFTALHGGSVWIEDSPAGGASFCVLLPRTRA
jgi:PAS domain S-box-containing protein